MVAEDLLYQRQKRQYSRTTQTPITRSQARRILIQKQKEQERRENREQMKEVVSETTKTLVKGTARLAGNVAKKTAQIALRAAMKVVQTSVQLVARAAAAVVTAIGPIPSLLLVGAGAIFVIWKHFQNAQAPEDVELGEDGFDASGRSSGRLSEKGIHFIANEEGLRTEAYQDSKGKWTIGIGHTGQVDGQPVGPGMVITEQKAKELFKKDVEKFENYVNRVVKVPVSQNMFDAMVSYSFNVGSLGPKFLAKLNSGDYMGAMRELTTIDKELRGRRAREQQLFGIDITEDNKLAVDAVTGQPVRNSSGGKITRLKNGTMVGGYKMSNPAAQRNYIDLSERAKVYLEQVGGSGIVTSGAEGHMANEGGISHGSGNKIDVIPVIANDQGWADLAIPFIKNDNTAYINFEDFDNARFQRIKAIIYSKLSQKYINKCEGPAQGKPNIRNLSNPKFMFCWRNKNHEVPALHLDIGIKQFDYKKKSTVDAGENKPKQVETPKPKPQSKPTTPTQGGKAGGKPSSFKNKQTSPQKKKNVNLSVPQFGYQGGNRKTPKK